MHVEADLTKVIEWADASNHPWAFSTSNAGAYYTRFFKNKEQLSKISWKAVASQDFRDRTVKEEKQAEFLVFDLFPWELVTRIGVIDEAIASQASTIIAGARHRPDVVIQPNWYY